MDVMGIDLKQPSPAQWQALEALNTDRGVYVQTLWRWLEGEPPADLLRACRHDLIALGGETLSEASCDQQFIGDGAMNWHQATLWSLPSAHRLVNLVQGAAFQALSNHAQALQTLVALQPARFTPRAMKATQTVMSLLPAPKANKPIPMDMMAGGVNPTASQFEVYRHSPQRTPIHMVNLLKFRVHPEYDGAEDRALGGKQAYAQRYGAVAAQSIFRLGGKMVAMGRYKLTLIGAAGDPSPGLWDEIAVLQYPGRYAFLNMLSNARYQAAALHRQAALERTELWATTPRA